MGPGTTGKPHDSSEEPTLAMRRKVELSRPHLRARVDATHLITLADLSVTFKPFSRIYIGVAEETSVTGALHPMASRVEQV